MTNRSYSITELATDFDITTRTIRFYEEKGLLNPQRKGQTRIYSAADRIKLKLILRGKRLGLSLEESKDIIEMYQPEHDNAVLKRLTTCKRNPVRLHKLHIPSQ
jgi:DNA-binding transcriptional MerR regulator